MILAVTVHSSAVQTVGLTDMYMQMHTDGTARQKARAAGESFPSAASSMRRDSCQNGIERSRSRQGAGENRARDEEGA